MPNLGRGVTQFLNFAIASLPDQARVGIRVAHDGSCRQHPRLHQHPRVFDRDVVHECIALTRETLHHMHLIGVEEPATPQPGCIGERDRVEHQRVAIPAPHGIAQIRDVELRLFTVRPAIGWDDAILAVSAASVPSRVYKGNVAVRLVNAPGRALPAFPI